MPENGECHHLTHPPSACPYKVVPGRKDGPHKPPARDVTGINIRYATYAEFSDIKEAVSRQVGRKITADELLVLMMDLWQREKP
jgi:hypothetical protein